MMSASLHGQVRKAQKVTSLRLESSDGVGVGVGVREGEASSAAWAREAAVLCRVGDILGGGC